MISVPASDAAGIHTGLDVRRGDTTKFHAQGRWCWRDGSECSDRDGTPGRPWPEERPTILDGEPFGKLIGRVGDWMFAIGSTAVVTAAADGELLLLMNDRVGYYHDNSGSITVEVTVTAAR
ncbi:MAG: hypothetical protein H5T64_08245 [Chloroflexi bacterium]|nr:hypothetical protein [Chloroflexota bacterium]